MKRCLVCGRTFTPAPVRGRPTQTCSQRCRATRKTQQRTQSRQRAMARGCPDHLHGTASGYTDYKCPCTKCRAWARHYQRGRRSGKTL